jgi:hypothetical protein
MTLISADVMGAIQRGMKLICFYRYLQRSAARTLLLLVMMIMMMIVLE